jgi:hypothetical protein
MYVSSESDPIPLDRIDKHKIRAKNLLTVCINWRSRMLHPKENRLMDARLEPLELRIECNTRLRTAVCLCVRPARFWRITETNGSGVSRTCGAADQGRGLRSAAKLQAKRL